MVSNDLPIRTIDIAGPDRRHARVLTLGARLQSLFVPDRVGRLGDIVLGYDDPEHYRGDPAFLGEVVGRYANRIAGGRFDLDGRTVRLDRNDGANHLHGGAAGFGTVAWSIAEQGESAVTLSLVSEDGDQGYPGRVAVTARYAFDASGELSIELDATTDAPTIVNLSHHAYFNLAGTPKADAILDHWLAIPASRFTPTDAGSIPTGELRDVTGTPFDFRTPKPIGRDIEAPDDQLRQSGGYDHNFVLDGADGTLRRVATLYDPASGRVLDLSSTKPGLQYYSGNFLGSDPAGAHPHRSALCLEPQFFPDSPNQPDFPSARLDPGDRYRHHIALRFRTASSVAEAFTP